MRPARLRSAAAATLRAVHARIPALAEWSGLGIVAYGVSRYSLGAGIIAAGLFLVAEAITTALS